MEIGFIRNNICFNVAVFDDIRIMQEFEKQLKKDGIVDNLVEIPEGFGIGDKYEDGVWSKQETPIIAQDPSTEERLAALEAAMSFMLGM